MMMMRKLVTVLSLYSLTAAEAHRLLQEGESCFTGFIMDNYCIKQGKMIDNGRDTLRFPEEHSIHCLVDVPDCVDSGFEVLTAPEDGGDEHQRAVRLDETGNTEALDLARTVGTSCSTCYGGGTQRNGFRATVTGFVGSGNPPLLQTTAVMSDSIDCRSLQVVLTDAPVVPPTESPVMPTEAPVEPTDAPVVPPTESPVIPTEAPVEPTDAPAIPPTGSPVMPTEAPVQTTEAPVQPTETPAEPTDAPVEPTESPVTPVSEPTKSPVTPPTGSPVATAPTPTEAPVPQTSTKAPTPDVPPITGAPTPVTSAPSAQPTDASAAVMSTPYYSMTSIVGLAFMLAEFL